MKPNILLFVSLIALTGIFDMMRELFLKTSINSLNFNVDHIKKVPGFVARIIMLPKAWLAFIFSVMSLFTYLFVLSKVDLSFAFSLDSMHYIFIALASRLILKEKFGTARWVGTAFIILGIIAVTMS